MSLLTADKDLSLIGVVYTRYHIHQRGLTASVLTEQGQYLALIHGQINVVISHYATETLGYTSQLYRYIFHIRWFSLPNFSSKNRNGISAL